MLETKKSREIDVAEYRHACANAIDDLANVFGPLQAAKDSDPMDVYTKFLPTNVNVTPKGIIASEIWELVERIALNLKFKKIRIFPREKRSLDGYVSWLIVNFAKEELTIIYDMMKVAGVFPLSQVKLSEDKAEIAASPQLPDEEIRKKEEIRKRSQVLDSKMYTYACEKIFGKILLHEIGHASLHGNWYKEGLGERTDDGRLVMPPKCEAQAWVYAHTAWGILVGDDSYAARSNKIKSTDEGYICS